MLNATTAVFAFAFVFNTRPPISRPFGSTHSGSREGRRNKIVPRIAM